MKPALAIFMVLILFVVFPITAICEIQFNPDQIVSAVNDNLAEWWTTLGQNPSKELYRISELHKGTPFSVGSFRITPLKNVDNYHIFVSGDFIYAYAPLTSESTLKNFHNQTFVWGMANDESLLTGERLEWWDYLMIIIEKHDEGANYQGRIFFDVYEHTEPYVAQTLLIVPHNYNIESLESTIQELEESAKNSF